VEKAAVDAGLKKSAVCGCTNSGHWAVNGLHSTENAGSYRGAFFVD